MLYITNLLLQLLDSVHSKLYVKLDKSTSPGGGTEAWEMGKEEAQLYQKEDSKRLGKMFAAVVKADRAKRK